jgi:hypothetical protein
LPYAWSNECNNNPGVCPVDPSENFAHFYIEVKNGFPYLMQEDFANQQLVLDDPFRLTKCRAWQRSHNIGSPNDPDFWDNCESDDYLLAYSQISPANVFNFILPNSQQVIIQISPTGVYSITAQDNDIQYLNMSDSWVDSSLWQRVRDTSESPWSNWSFEDEWRVYGTYGADPWDAPPHIQSRYHTWPPEDDDDIKYKLETCEHFEGHEAGTVNYDNVNEWDDNYRSSDAGLKEVASLASKGPWSQLYYQTENYVEFVHDIVDPEFKQIRIEKVDDYWRIYMGFGDGAAVNLTSDFIKLITEKDAWDSRLWAYVIDIFADGTITVVDFGTGVSWPEFDTEFVLYDTELEINRGLKIQPSSIGEVLSTEGQVEYEIIADAQKDQFRDQGWHDSNIYLTYITPMVPKVSKVVI